MSGGARRFALLGSPVKHSVSPAIHRAAFRALGLAATYEAVRVDGREVEGVVRRYARDGGGGNVTLPHKGRVAPLLDRPSRAVEGTGACNCFWEEGGALAGDNTDVEGFLAALREHPAGVGARGSRVLLLGAGGAARAVAYACAAAGAESLEILNRTRERAVDVARLAESAGGRVAVLAAPEEATGPYDLAVNATSLGIRPADPLPLDLREGRARAVLDLVYAPGGTAWTRHAADLGIPARDGLAMLVHQAALSLRRWFPERAPPLEEMRRAARAARGAREAVP